MSYPTYMNIKNIDIEYNGIPIKIELLNVKHMNPHYHESSLEFVYCLKGRIYLHSGFQHFTLGVNDICSIDCRDIHCFHSTEDNLVLFCHIDLKSCSMPFDYLKYVFFACETANSYPYQREALEWLEKTFLTLAFIQSDPQTVIMPDYRSIVDEIIAKMLRYFNYYTYLDNEGYINQALYDRFHNILIYCQQHYNERINISHLAKQEHISKNYMSQFIRKTNVKNFNSIIKFIRCYEAEHMMLTTDVSIADASYACGFSDPKYFYPFFKFMWGCTPKQHRDWYRNFMSQNDDFYTYKQDAVFAFMKKHIPLWLVNNTIIKQGE